MNNNIVETIKTYLYLYRFVFDLLINNTKTAIKQNTNTAAVLKPDAYIVGDNDIAILDMKPAPIKVYEANKVAKESDNIIISYKTITIINAQVI